MEKWNFRKLTKTGEGLITYRSAVIEILELLFSIQRSPRGIIDEVEDAQAQPAHKGGLQVLVGMQRRARSLSDLGTHSDISTVPSLSHRRNSFPTLASAVPIQKWKGDHIHPPFISHSSSRFPKESRSKSNAVWREQKWNCALILAQNLVCLSFQTCRIFSFYHMWSLSSSEKLLQPIYVWHIHISLCLNTEHSLKPIWPSLNLPVTKARPAPSRETPLFPTSTSVAILPNPCTLMPVTVGCGCS